MNVSASLAGRRFLVTGGTRGIGAAITRRLAADGAAVVANYARNDNAARRFLFHSVSAPDIGPSAAAALAGLQDPTVSPDFGQRLAAAKSEELRRLLVLALRLDASPAAHAELERFAKTVAGSAQLQEEVRQWLVR